MEGAGLWWLKPNSVQLACSGMSITVRLSITAMNNDGWRVVVVFTSDTPKVLLSPSGDRADIQVRNRSVVNDPAGSVAVLDSLHLVPRKTNLASLSQAGLGAGRIASLLGRREILLNSRSCDGRKQRRTVGRRTSRPTRGACRTCQRNRAGLRVGTIVVRDAAVAPSPPGAFARSRTPGVSLFPGVAGMSNVD